MKIAILDDYQHCVQSLDCFEMLSEHQVKIFTNGARGIGQLAMRLAEFDVLVLIGERTQVPAALLNKLPKLKLISQVGSSCGHIDMAAATARKIAVANGISDPAAPAELTWALIMAASRKIPQYADHLKNGTWQTVSFSTAHNSLGAALRGRTLGVWGYGKIGRLVAGFGKAFGMNVVVWGRKRSQAAAEADGYAVAPSRESFFSDCDVITLHLQLNEATRGIVSSEDLAHMKSSALFVNTSHAGLVQSGALLAALHNGRPGYAAIDVFETEPTPADCALLRLQNVLATPHIGYVEKDSYEQMFRAAFQNIIDFSNQIAGNIVNPEVLSLDDSVKSVPPQHD